MGVQHKGGMYNMKRVIALLLTLVMLLGLVPTALAAEAAAPDGTVVKAEEVSGTPRLDAMAENGSAAETTQPTGHQPDDMVTILVELERAPVLEGFAAKKTASTSSAGAEIAAYLAGGRAETGCRHSPGSEKGLCRDPGGPARRSPGGGHLHCLCP